MSPYLENLTATERGVVARQIIKCNFELDRVHRLQRCVSSFLDEVSFAKQRSYSPLGDEVASSYTAIYKEFLASALKINEGCETILGHIKSILDELPR